MKGKARKSFRVFGTSTPGRRDAGECRKTLERVFVSPGLQRRDAGTPGNAGERSEELCVASEFKSRWAGKQGNEGKGSKEFSCLRDFNAGTPGRRGMQGNARKSFRVSGTSTPGRRDAGECGG